MGGSAHTLCVLEEKKIPSQSALLIKKLKATEGQHALPMGCGEKNSHCRGAWTEDTSGVIKEDVSKGPEFWFQVL